MNHLPSLKNIHYLVNLYQEQNFRRAAQVCHVSQSTLSSGIQNLEEQLGQQLIERDHKSFIFTQLGIEVVKRSVNILNDVNELYEMVRYEGEPMSGELHLGCIPTIAPFVLTDLMEVCQTHYPKLSVLPKEDTTDNLLRALGKGDLDILLLALPVDIASCHSMKVGIDPFKLVMHKETAEKIDSPFLYSELPDDSIYLLDKEHCLTGHAITACKLDNNLKINPFSAMSLHTLVQIVNSKLGVTFLPQMAIKSGILENTDLVTVTPPGEKPYREIGLVWRQTSSRLVTFRTLGAQIKALFIR